MNSNMERSLLNRQTNWANMPRNVPSAKHLGLQKLHQKTRMPRRVSAATWKIQTMLIVVSKAFVKYENQGTKMSSHERKSGKECSFRTRTAVRFGNVTEECNRLRTPQIPLLYKVRSSINHEKRPGV